MSITFFCPEAPSTDEVYECGCDSWSKDGKPIPDCHECQGTGEIRFPIKDGEFNIANSNGMALQRFLALEPEYGGEFPLEKIPILKGIVDGYLNNPKQLKWRTEWAWGTAHRLVPGQVQGYLMALSALASIAIKHDAPIHWG